MPGRQIHNSLQTNGILLDDPWCEFLREHDFLVGLSIDGPVNLHDKYRRDKQGRGTFDQVTRAMRRLFRHGVEFIQFIPIVEPAKLPKCCRECEVLFACNGACPRDRFLRSPDGEPGLNYLCEGYKMFFTHVGPSMKCMADEIRAGRPAGGIMRQLRARLTVSPGTAILVSLPS